MSIIIGMLATAIIMAIYFAVVAMVSGITYALEQFAIYWPYLISLAIGFGVQMGLFVWLKRFARKLKAGKMVAVSGATSTAAMVSCCAHYLANILPFLGAVGIASVISAYQIKLFWVGIIFNAAGIAYLIHKIIIYRHHAYEK